MTDDDVKVKVYLMFKADKSVLCNDYKNSTVNGLILIPSHVEITQTIYDRKCMVFKGEFNFDSAFLSMFKKVYLNDFRKVPTEKDKDVYWYELD